MAELSLRWVLRGEDRAVCVLGGGGDDGVRIPVSRLTSAPEDLLAALTALVTGELSSTVRWRSESFLHHWHFARSGALVNISVRRLPDGTDTDDQGAEIWSTEHPVRAFARAVIRAFDHVLRTYGRVGYRQQWGAPFPRNELESLRASCRTAKAS